MQDIWPHSKAIFWILLLAFLSLSMIPSIVLVDACKQYYRFLTLWDPGTLQAMRMRRLPHYELHSADVPSPEVYFTSFQISAPQAHQVLLAGDFNRWKPETLPLEPSPGRRGSWEVTVPLPPGRYQYLFQVDGIWTPDPKAQADGRRGALKTCIRQVPEEIQAKER